MTEDTWRRLEQNLTEFPSLVAEPATAEEIDAASQRLGVVFPADYREFLLRTGGSYVGSVQIYGTRTTPDMAPYETVTGMTERFQGTDWPGIETWAIVSMDGRGNPVGLAEDGGVWRSDHDVGDVTQLAGTFEEFIRRVCLNLPA